MKGAINMALMTQAQHDRALEIMKQCKRFMDWAYDEMQDSGLLQQGYTLKMWLSMWAANDMEDILKYGPHHMVVEIEKDPARYEDFWETQITCMKFAAEGGEWSVTHDTDFIYTAALSDGTGDTAKAETGEKAAGKELPPDGLWLRADYDPDLLDCGRDVK